MPYTEYGTRDSGDGTEVHHGKGGCKTGVLHADLDGDSLGFCKIHMGDLGNRIAEQIAKDVVAHDDKHDEQAGLHDLLGADSYDTADDKHDGDNGNERQELNAFLYEAAEKAIDDDTENDRNDDNLEDRNHHI